MNGKQTISALQREVSRLQGASIAVPEALQRQLQALQNQLNAQGLAEVDPRIPIVQPTPPPINLPPDQMTVWTTFSEYLGALCQYSGGVNRGQWLHLVDVAADLTGAAYSIALEGFVPEAPTGTLQPWSRNGQTGTWVLTTPPPPTTGSGYYAWDAANSVWAPVTTSGPAAPVNNPSGGQNNYAAIDSTAPKTNPAGGANNYGPLMGRTNGTTPSAGQIGELISASASSVNVPVRNTFGVVGTTWVTLTQITLTPGDWNVFGTCSMNGLGIAATSPFLAVGGYFSTVAPPATPNALASFFTVQAEWEAAAWPVGTQPMSVSAATVVYLIANADTPTASDDGKIVQFAGTIYARRVS